MWSIVFLVPVMFFNIYTSGGKLVSVDQLLDVLPQLRGNNTDTGWCYLTQAEHPVLGIPFYQLHPCNTATFMSNLWAKDECTAQQWVSCWISLVESTLRLSHQPRLALDTAKADATPSNSGSVLDVTASHCDPTEDEALEHEALAVVPLVDPDTTPHLD